MDILYTILFMLFALVMWCCYIYLNRRVEMLEDEKIKMRRRIDEIEFAVEELINRTSPGITANDSTVYNTAPPYTQTLTTDNE